MTDSALLERLNDMGRALCYSSGRAFGLEPDDLVSAGWLGYTTSRMKGRSVPLSLARARGAMLDEIRAWGGIPHDHRTGELLGSHVSLAGIKKVAVQEPSDPHPRTRLPPRVRRALRKLPRSQHEAIRMWTVEGWDHPIIMDCLGINRNQSAGLRHRALCNLRGMLGLVS